MEMSTGSTPHGCIWTTLQSHRLAQYSADGDLRLRPEKGMARQHRFGWSRESLLNIFVC
jgi:hypothetical protein